MGTFILEWRELILAIDLLILKGLSENLSQRSWCIEKVKIHEATPQSRSISAMTNKKIKVKCWSIDCQCHSIGLTCFIHQIFPGHYMGLCCIKNDILIFVVFCPIEISIQFWYVISFSMQISLGLNAINLVCTYVGHSHVEWFFSLEFVWQSPVDG